MTPEDKKIEPQNTKGYRTAFKATAIFGGSQAITIIISIVKSKLVAIWLGPFGMGLMGLFNTAISLVQHITNLGLQSSAVRDIAKNSHDPNALAVIVKSLGRWIFGCGILGTLITIAISPLLSHIYFDNYDYTLSFVFLSIIVLIHGVTQQQVALLQGMRKLKDLVKANIYGALIGFVLSVPCFYFFRNNGIVPALILTAIGSMIASTIYSRRIKILKVTQTYRESFKLGISAVKLGIAMALSMIMVSVVEFVVRTFIAKTGSISDVGLYTAGWAINGQYLGLIFTAMAKDYYPRLSQQCENNSKLSSMMNEQAEIAILILAPMISVMFICLPLFVRILYSESFMSSVAMIRWLLIGSLVKAGSWSISFLFLAKSDSKGYLFNELGIKFVTLPSYLLFYKYFGLVGIGYAYTFNYSVYFIWVGIVALKRFGLYLDKKFFGMFAFNVSALILMAIINSLELRDIINYLMLSCVAIIVVSVNLYKLNQRISILSLLRKK